ncbi:STAS domain-containing protein [Streptomyces sp. NPDC051098]|uniref:STAS domain-containing protein n=1 Tax=Streptomyces sp. NPDC051098 TaxID=3155411 RepID=UPI00341BEF30
MKLDYETSDSFRRHVLGLLDQRASDVTDLRLDCRELELIDSMGLSALLAIHRITSAAGITLHLDNRPDRLQRMLEITGTDEHLTRPAASQHTTETTTPAVERQAGRPRH